MRNPFTSRKPSPRDRPPAPFVVGVGRSGTTLLRMMLDAHPVLTIPPETHFVPAVIALATEREASAEALVAAITDDSHRRWGDFGLDRDQLLERVRAAGEPTATVALRSFYELYAERIGKPRWGDKTPNYVRKMPQIEAALPEARFVHLIRDGRDVALSYNRRWERHEGKEPWPAAEHAARWKQHIGKARRKARHLRHYLELRYEDLVSEPEPALRRVCDFAQLDFEPAMLEYHHGASERLAEMARDLPAEGDRPARPARERLDAHALTTEPPKRERIFVWREEMPESERAEFEAVAGSLLDELGYETGAPRSLAH